MSDSSTLLPFAAPGELDPFSVAHYLETRGVPADVTPDGLRKVLVLAGQIHRVPGRGFVPRVLVGHGRAQVVVHLISAGGAAARGPLTPRCDSCFVEEGLCVHEVAAVLNAAWQVPAEREAMTRPAWRSLMSALAAPRPEPGAKPKPTADAPAHDGWVRYILSPDPGDDPWDDENPLDTVVSRQIMRRAKRSGETLAPMKFPRKLADAEKKIPLTETDRELDRCFDEVRVLESTGGRYFGPSGQALRLQADLVARALRHLLHVQDLWFGEDQVTPDPTPVSPRIVVEDGPGESLVLRWAPHTRFIWDEGPGFVLTHDLQFRPLDPKTSPALKAHLGQPLPAVPLAAAGEFLREFVVGSGLPVDLAARKLPHLRATKTPPTARLRLSEHEGALTVAPTFVYRDADHVREVAPADTAPWVVFSDAAGAASAPDALPHLAARDTEREAAALDALAALCPGPYPATLRDDAALALLSEIATEGTELRGAWEPLFDSKLAGIKAVGRFTPSVTVRSGLDWFDVDVRFETPTGRRVKPSLGQLIEAWRAGRRFVRLSDGAIGRVPAEWLARHGEQVAQLEEIKAAGDGHLRAFAAPLAADLLDEGGAGGAGPAERWRQLSARIKAFERIPEWPLPPGLTATLRDYQVRGFHWLVWLRDLDLGGVLADDMGLGKTVQTLALLLDTHAEPDGPPSLVVCPTSVVHTWVAEATRFTPELRVHLHHGGARGEALPARGAVDLVVTSYALLRQDETLFREARFRYVILDEAQTIKNPASQIAQLCHALQADHRLAVTGTPLENNLVELWSLFQFLMPGFFGGRTAFNARFTTPVQKHRDDEALAALRSRTRPFVLRRRKDEVARELPPRTEQVLYCELDPTQRRLYEAVKDTYRAQVLEKVDALGVGRATIQILEALTRLRQACCDPRLLPFDEARAVSASAKRTLLLDTLDEIVAEGHRALVFSQWPSLLRLVEEDLKAGHMAYLYLDGGTTERKSLVDRWNAPDGPPVFLISLKAGGTGLNLTGADHVIHLDPWWNPAVEAQATDRAHRIGQTRPVVVYKLVARDTVEEKILELQARKRALFEAAVDADRMLLDALTRQDLEAVFAPGR